MKKALEQIDKSTLYMYLFDSKMLSMEEVKADLEELDASKSRLVVANKTDLIDDVKAQLLTNSGLDVLSISAKQKDSLEQLKESLYDAVNFDASDQDQSIVTNARHYQGLKNTKNALQEVLNAIEMGVGGDLLSIDIKQALHYLGEITGEITTDDLLDSIFRDFCIGK